MDISSHPASISLDEGLPCSNLASCIYISSDKSFDAKDILDVNDRIVEKYDGERLDRRIPRCMELKIKTASFDSHCPNIVSEVGMLALVKVSICCA